jgi:glycosyltransferase involved in cell wall biosynthesis
MPKKPTVSVVIPCYNSAAFVERTIRSVLNQTYSLEEILCIDDGSTDRTLNVLQSICESEACVTVHTQENEGICGARNTGLERVTGEYVAFLDHDDVLHPEKLQHQAELVADHSRHPDFVAAAYENVYPDSDTVGQTRQIRTDDRWIGLIHAQLGRTSSNLWRAKSVREAGAWQDADGLSLDTGLMFRLFKRGARFISDPAPMTTRYVRETSASRTDRTSQWHTFLTLRARIYEYLCSTGQLSTDRLEALHVDMIRAVRDLYVQDPDLALRLHEKHVRGFFHSSRADFGPGRLYRALYRLFGFQRAELLYPVWLRLRDFLS